MRKFSSLFGVVLSMLSVVSLFACSHHLYIEEHTNEWLARPLSELKEDMKRPDSYASKIKWEETTYPLSNGYYVFVEPIADGCSIHWDVNNRDRIIGYRAVGSECEHKSGSSNATSADTMQSVTKPTDRY